MCFPPKYLTTQRNRHARLTHWSFLYLITSHIYCFESELFIQVSWGNGIMPKIGKTWSQSNPFQPGPHSQVHGPSQTPLTLFCFTSLGNSFKSWSHRFGSQDMEHTQCSCDPGEEYVDNLWQRSCTLSNLVSWLAGAIPGHLAESLLWMTTWSARGSVAERTCE